MPPSMQGKLLRVIQEKRILRVGSSRPIQLDLRFIAATNKNLKQEVQAGKFREDLYFRLNVVQITLPGLAERPEDVPLLIQYFITRYSKKFSKKIKGLDSQAREILLSYGFPGNVRELQNLLERAVALAEGDTITAADLPPELQEYRGAAEGPWITLEDRERDYIRKVLHFTRYNISETARILDLPRTTLWRKMKKYDLMKSS
jgi:two-component system response regulator AtoC